MGTAGALPIALYLFRHDWTPGFIYRGAVKASEQVRIDYLGTQVVERARGLGVNLAFLGANAAFRHIRFHPSRLGPDREEINYKLAFEDPMDGVHDAQVTTDWMKSPLDRPESELTGAMYQCNPVHAAMRFVRTPAWLFEGSRLRPGSSLRRA